MHTNNFHPQANNPFHFSATHRCKEIKLTSGSEGTSFTRCCRSKLGLASAPCSYHADERCEMACRRGVTHTFKLGDQIWSAWSLQLLLSSAVLGSTSTSQIALAAAVTVSRRWWNFSAKQSWNVLLMDYPLQFASCRCTSLLFFRISFMCVSQCWAQIQHFITN